MAIEFSVIIVNWNARAHLARGERDDAEPVLRRLLTLAPATDPGPGDTPFHYGRINDSPEVFLLDADTSETLLGPLGKK